MKSNPFRLLICLLALFALTSCGLPNQPTYDQQKALADGLSRTASSFEQTSAELHATAAAASTQPAIPASVPKAINQAGDAASKAAEVARAGAVSATQPAANPITIVVDTGVGLAKTGAIPEPLATYVALAGAIFGTGGLGWGLINLFKRQKSDSAAASSTDAVHQSITDGTMVVKPGASATINKFVDANHPSTDALVDIVRAAENAAKP